MKIKTSTYHEYPVYSPSVDYFADTSTIQHSIRKLLTRAVEKRLQSDREIGFLLSGGLDSSLIVAIATRILGPDRIVCFSVGLPNSPDVIAAKSVTAFLNIRNHHIIDFDVGSAIELLPEVIDTIETYDITTIRASTPQYIMARYISTNTNVKVILSGEGSDEIHGSYRYFRDAPNHQQFYDESVRLTRELYLFDCQRTDRTMAGNGLEVRVPFLDFEYVDYIQHIDPKLLLYKSNQMEKQLIRDSFVGYLPDEILYRSKEAFSDAVSDNATNWANAVIEYSQSYVEKYNLQPKIYHLNPPRTADALYFRHVFNNIYPGCDEVLPYYWLPKFQTAEILDPSARVLSSY